VALPRLTRSENVIDDYRATRLSLRGHPLTFLRPIYARQGAMTCAEVLKAKHGSRICVAGVVLIRQRPGSSGVVFVTIEDETGVANIVVWPRLFDQVSAGGDGGACDDRSRAASSVSTASAPRNRCFRSMARRGRRCRSSISSPAR